MKMDLNAKEHEEILAMGWEEAGYCSVDAGIIHIGDPCYILPRKIDNDPGYDYDTYIDQIKHSPDDEPYIEKPDEYWDKNTTTERKTEILEEILKLYHQKRKEIYAEWSQTAGVTKYKHEAGHEGKGVCISNFGGDGGYNVYVQRSKSGGIVAAMIKFHHLDDWQEDNENKEESNIPN